MTAYKRFIAYVYEYQKDKKGENRGFLKVESRNGVCTIELHLVGACSGEGAPCRIYGYVRRQGKMLGILLGNCSGGDMHTDCILTLEEKNMSGQGYSLNDLGGMLLLGEDGSVYGTEWDDEPIKPSLFEPLKTPNANRAAQGQQDAETMPEESSLAEDGEGSEDVMDGLGGSGEGETEDSLQNAEPEETEGFEKILQNDEMAGIEEGRQNEMPEEAGESHQNEMPEEAGEDRQNEMPEDTGEDRQGELPKDSAEVRQRELQEEAKEDRRSVAPEETDEPGEQEEYLQRERPSESEEIGWDNRSEDSKSSRTADLERQGGLEAESSEARQKNEEASVHRPQQGRTRWESFCPFDDEEITDCIKVTPRDLTHLHKRDWGLGSNNFLLHGFYAFGHLLIGRLRDRNQWILAVPGIYDRQEKFMAGMLGFPYFKSVRKKGYPAGKYGYWYRLINPPDFYAGNRF